MVVLSIAIAQKLGECEIWLAFGTGDHFRYIAAHDIATSLGPQRSLALPIFHAFTGCDTVSSFSNIGKKTAWKTWEAHQGLTRTFTQLSRTPDLVSDDTLKELERFTILLYDRTSTSSCINETRQLLFTHKGRQMQGLPPTQAALEQHIKRAVLQGGHDWGQAMIRDRVLPSPGD